MFDEQDRQYFYNEFKNNGYEVGSYDDFKKDLNNKEDRDWYYNEAKNMGYDVGTQADFDKMVLEPAPSTSGGGKQVDASATTQSVEQKASTETKPQVAQPAKKLETTDKDPGLIAKVLDMIPTGVQMSNGTYQPSPEIPQPVVKGEEMPVKEETSSSSSANAASPESKEVAPVTTPTGVVNNEGLMDAKLANYLENWKQRPDKQSTYFENLVADLLADGTANSNEEAVNMVMPALHRYANRSAMDVTNQVVSSLPDDTVQDAEKSIEAQWYSHGVQDKLKQEAYNMGISYDDYVGLFLKPAMVQSLVNKYGPKYRDIAEGIATRLYSHDENVQDRLMNQDINDALSSVISKYVNPSVVDEYNKAQEAGSKAFTEGMEGSQFIPANLRLGTALGAQYEANEAKDPAKVLSSLQKKFGRLYRNPEFLNDMSNAAFKVMQRYGLNGTQSSDPKQFKPMINSVLKNELDQLEIKGMMPKGSAEYIMKTGLGNTIVGKITRKAIQTDYQNWLEDIANQQYQPGFWENVASGALTFAGDAWSYWLPGAAGGKLTKSMVAKAEGKLAGDLMAKGMERKMAERAAKVLIGKSKAAALKSGAAHGAVTFGGQSAISKPIDEIYRTGQFDENGKIYNPSVGKVIANTLGEVAKQSAVGAIMQGGTIANMVGKGRGLATNILADIGGKVVDSGIMTGQQLLERMAHDPNFKPTGKDAAETFLESGANLLSIGFPGFVGKYARFKDAREFNKKFDFTDQDIAELKRFGYDGLRDAFEKVGIGEYAVVGENAQRLDGQLTQKYMDLMNDKSVPEVLKAKMMAVVEGKRPSSFSPIVDSIIVQPMDNDGKVYLETLNKNGGIVERKEFASLDEAQKADKKLEYEKTLGLASVLEGEFHNEFTQEHLDGLYNKAAQKYNMGEKLTDEDKAAVYLHQNAGAIKEIMDKQQKGIILTDEEQKQVNAYRHYYDSALENSSVMREFVNTFEDSHGVARGTLRKALESKDKKYAPLVESYLKELYNSIELKREMKQIEDDKKRIEQGDVDGAKPATSVEGPASVEGSAGGQEPPVSEKPAPYQDRTNSVPTPSDAEVAANPANSAAEGAGNEPKVANSDAFVMGQNAYKNGDSDALQAIDYNSDLATGRLKRAFADNEKMPDIVANAYNEGRDMEQFVAQRASSLAPAQKEAISKYVEAMDAKKGAIDALQHADDGYGEALKQQLWPYQTEDGNIVPATLDSGKQVFLKKANEYGGAFVVVPDEQGQPTIKQVSNAEIKEVGTPVSLDEYIENTVAQQKDARAQQFISQFDGSGLKPNDLVTVAMEEGDANINMTFAGYSKDGKIVLTDGKDYLPLSKEEFAAWRKNALDNTINQHLDAEDAKREQEAASQAEADKQERYKKGIFGYAAGKPDYSDTQTDPKVAAEYLQETAGEDRKALFANIVAEKQALQKRISQLREHIANNEEWLSLNADLDPENAETRSLANKQMQGQIVDLQARFDQWNKIRSAVMTPEEAEAIKADRTKKIAEAGVNDGDVAPVEGREIAVLSDEELKKQYPTMDEASSYITSERKRIYRIQSDEVQREINGVDEVLDRYVNGEIDLEPEQLKELNTTKAQLQARQQNLTESAKDLKAQADKLKTLYRKENMVARAKAMENMTPAEQRAIKVENAIKTGNLSLLNAIYEEVRGATDFTDTEPNTIEEYVANNIGRFSLNYEGKDKAGVLSNGIKQETGLGRKDFDKLQILAKEGEGKTVPEFVHSLYDNMPEQLKQMGYSDQDIRDAFLNLISSVENYSDLKNYTLNNKVAEAEQQLRTLEHQEEEMMEEATSYEINYETAPFADRLETAISETETEPTEAQKKAGNYKKGHLSFGGYDYTVETPKGVTRSGKDEQGKPWSVTMHDTYGYILGKIGVDGDHIDMFINDAADLDTFDGNVYVVDQVNPETGEFDEHKVMYGYPDEAAATKAYLSNYSKGWKGLGKVTSVPKATFDKWLESSDRKTKPFRDYAMIQHEEAKKAKQANEALPFDAPMSMDDLPFHRDVKEVKPENLTEAQKVAYDAVSTMLHKAGIPVKVVSNEDMEKVAEAQDNMAVEMLLNDPRLRFYIKTPEQKEAAKAAYDWAAKNRPDKFKQYAIVNMDNPNQPPQYFEKKDLAEKWRKYYTNAWKIGNYKAFNLNKPFEEQIKDVKGDVPSEFDPYKAESLFNKRIELERQIKETEDSYNAKKKERAEYQNQLMQDYMDQHGLSSENDIPDDVWTDYRDKSFEKYQDTLDDLFHKYVELDNQLKAVAEPGVRFLRTYHGTGASFDKFDLSHALEGEGSETFGHGVYVTNSKEIGTDYAQRAKDKKAIFGFEFVNPQSMSKEAQDMLRHYMYKHQDVAKGLENARKDLKDVIGKFPDTDYLQELNEILAKEDDSIAMPSNRAYRYDVDIPDDNGSNYLGWNESQNFPLEKWYRLWEITHNGFSENEYFKDGGARYDIDRIERITQMKLESPENGMQKLPTLKGEELYHALEDFFDRERPSYGAELASRALGEIGFVGIKYPAGMIHGGAKEGDYNYVVFDENNANIVGNTKFAQGKGVVYGYTDGKEIVLNQEHLNPNTPIHEYQHLWRTAAKNMNPELIEHGDKLIMQTQLFADLKQDPNYNHLTDEQICDEAFARLTGEDGAAILEQMAKDAIKENPLDTAKELSVINKLKEWLKKFWYWTLDTFTKWKPEDIKKMTLEDIRNLVMRDLANGVDPRTKLHEAENADDIKFMGSTTKKRMKSIASLFEGRELNKDQQTVADVYSGKKDNLPLTVEREDGNLKIIMRQGNDNHAGTKHSVFRHYGVKANSLNIDDLLLIPTVLKEGERKVSDNGRVAYVYVDPTSQVKYTVVTEPKNNKEFFNDFYSNKKANPSETSRVVENSTNTPEGAHNNDGNAFMRAKVDNNSETAKENGENLSVEDKIKAVSQQFGVDEADVAMYANAIKKGSTSEAARARANIKRHLLQANEDKISSFKELLKYTVPVNEALKENFGDVDAMIEERKQQMEAQRNAMEAARKRAEEEEAKRQKHLEELSLIPDDQLDKQYMDALAKGDDATAREMLDEAARRKGYDDTESAYQGVGAWAAPGNPGYESDKARRDDWESSGSDVNLEDIALGYTPQPDDYFSHPERYSQNTPYGLESVTAINTAIDAIKNGEKDVKVKVYRAVPTSVKEGKLRNGDWVTPSKKYAEMHGTNRLEGKYRIIEDEVPANQLWWDGNDANEFGFDDGKAYKYKNAKNNRKLNDLVTYDDEGDVIPPSKRFNSRKSDIRFMFGGEKGAAEADKAEEKTYRMDNLKVAEKMERGKKDAKAIKLATGWERGADGKWRYEMPDAKIKDMKDIGGGNIVKRFDDDMLWNDGKLADVIDAPGLFEAYPQLKDVRIDTDAIMNDMPSNGEYNAKTNTITIHADELKYMNSILNHEIQHAIQHIEGFTRGGSPRLIRGEVKKKFNEVTKQIRQLRAEGKEDEAKALVEKNRGLYNAYQKNDDYNSYKSLAGEVEARNVESRMGMTDEERRNSLAEETEDVNRDEQIVMNVGDTSYSIVKDPEIIKKLDKEDTVKVYRAMQVGEDGKLYPPMAAKVKGKFVEPIELGKWEQADERPELADDKGMFTLNKGNGKSLKAAYNPYLHTSRTPLNDQFSEAQNRPNIVTVEVEVPKSELTSGYKADKAKDAVGEVEWKAGIIQGQLTGKRKVVLSRWDKPVRIVPDSEVADVIVNDMFKGKNITMPSNVVTPSLRKELEKRGVPFVETDNRGRIVGGENDGVHYSKVYGKNAQSPVLEQKLKKHPDSLMKAGTYFSGGGLVEEGLKGIIDPVVAVEYDRKISGVYRNNFGQHIVTADVRDVDPKELVKHIDGEVEYFHASPVCKNYSQAKSNSGEVELDKETAKSTAEFIDAVKPRVVTIENVKGYKDSEAMKIITKALDKNGYTWDSDVYNAADYGGYTSRERLIVRAVKDGELPEKPKKQPRKGGWLEAVEDILPTLKVKESGVAPWMDARLKADGIDWQKVEKPLYVMGSAYADGKIPHAYGDEILPTLRTKSGDVIIMPGGKVLRADGRVLARITGLGDDYKLPKTESLAHTIIGNGIPVQLTKGVIAPLLNKDDLSGRNILARLGSSIFKNNWDADKQKQVSDRVVNTANKLGGAEATVYTSVDEVPDAYLSDVKNGATGWYDPTTHTVHVYLPNCADANEAERTVLHEKIGHEGIEVLLGGEDGVRKFANFVYRSVGKDVRGKIIDFANKYDPDWKNPDRMNVGTQEYIAHLAEEGPKTAEDFSLWTKIKHYLIKLLKKLGVRVPGLLNDKDLRYYLMKAGKALHVWDNMPKEKQEAMMKQASNAEIKDALSDGAGKGKPRQKKGESTIQYMKRVQEWRKWQNAREDKENPEPPMFYDIDKDEAGKKEWAQLNKDWRERHHLVGEEPTGMPIRMENEEDDAYMNRIHEYENWQAAMKDQEDPLPDMFAFEKKKQEEVKRKYEDWLAKHDLLEQQQADLDLYEGKIYPAETNPKADALEQQVMQDLAEVTSTDVSKEGAAMTVKHAVIHRRKNMEEASADDAIYINDVKNRIEKMADSGVFDKLLSDYKGKKNRAEKLAETIPYIIEAPRRLRDMAHNLNATGVFDKGHIHIQPADVEAIQPYVTDLITETAKKHTEIKKGKEIEVYDDPKAVSEVASKMAQAINANHQGEEGFVPCDGTDILSKHVLKLVKERVVPGRINYKELSPEMQAAIDSIRDWYNYTYDWLMDNHTLKAGTGYNVDYVNHIWDKEKSDPEAYATFVENRQRTKSPNEKPRTISTLMEGIYAGLVPKTTDITKMMAYYSRSNIEAWANKTMLQELTGLNVIERNEKGEVISTDPLLSSSAPFNLEQYKYFEIPGVGPVWVYNVSPKQVKVKNPITDNEKVIYSEASAGDRFGVVFDTYQSSPFWKTFDTLASSAKKLELGFSGFHAGALTEVYMVQNMVEFGPKKAMANFMKYIFADTAKNHELPCFANPEDFQEAASHLVKFGATNDYAAADVQNMFDNMRDAMMKVQEKLKDGNKISGTVAKASMPLKVATQMLSLINKGMDVALWDFLHDGLKLATYRMRADKTKERAKEKGWSAEELNRALDEDGQFVNDMFGGQHWDVLGASHRTLRYAGRVLLSPDWNASTTRHFLALTGFGSIWNEATFENFKQYYKRLKHKELTPEDEGRRSRQISALLCYGIGFMVFYEGIANGINAAFRALDEEKERKKADEIRKTNPSYKSMYELAYGDEGMKWYDYLMRGNSLGQQSKIFLGRYEDGTEMYVRHGKQFREVPEYLFNHKGELEFPGPMVQRMIGKANPMVRMTLDDINYLSDFQASHADQEIQRKYGKTIGLLYKDALYWAPFLIPSQENKEFKAVDFFFPSSKGFSPWKAQSYFKDFILSGDMEGVVMTYQSCQRNGIDPEAQIKAAIGSVKALESAEMSDGVTSLQEASKRFDAAKSITEKKKMRQKMKKFLSQSDYKAFTQKEALDMVQGYLNGDEDLKEMEKAESKYLMKAKAEDVTEDWRIQNVWNGTMQTYQEYQRLKDVDKAKANAFKNSKTNKRLFAARKAISAARRKMNKAKKQMDGTNDAAKLVEIRNTRKELLKTLNGME
jgi:site-specific DNA-cytosine methylase